MLCEVVTGGLLHSNKGVSVPDSSLSLSSITEADREHVRFALSQRVDYVAMSFVRTADDLREMRWLMRHLNGDAALIAKIDADDQQNLLARFEMASGLPAALLVRKGEPVVTLAGDDLRNVGAWLAHAVEGKPRPELQSVDAAGEGRAALPVTLTDANFQEVVSGPGPVLVDFWAAWCGPCRTIAPHVAQLARDFAGRATVAKLNIDENPRTTQHYDIMSMPALFIFKNGAVVEEIIGVQPLAVLPLQEACLAGRWTAFAPDGFALHAPSPVPWALALLAMVNVSTWTPCLVIAFTQGNSPWARNKCNDAGAEPRGRGECP